MNGSWPNIPGYDVEAEIGRGGMGVVYRVRRRGDGAVLALKMILGSRGATFAELARFRIEAEALACLNHPNIVKIRDVGVDAGHPFFAMDFAERGSLKHAISRAPQRPMWAAELVRTLALAMQHAHERGMLHRDLKPANVLLMGDGTPIVTDFGLVKFTNPLREVSDQYYTRSVSVLDEELARLARELGAEYNPVADAPAVSEDEITRRTWEQCAARTGVLGDGTRLQSIRRFLSEVQQQSQDAGLDIDDLTKSGAIMGSPNYMAPEQARGDLARIGPLTDVYALGGILYELLTGQPPFRSERFSDMLSKICFHPPIPPRQLAPDVSGDVEAVCLKCLEKSPAGRYQSAVTLAEDLSRFLDGYLPRAVLAAVSGAQPASPVASEDGPPILTQPAPALLGQPAAATRSWWPFGKNRSKASGGAV